MVGWSVWLLVYVAQFSSGLSIDIALSDLSFVQCLNFILSKCFVHVALAGGNAFQFYMFTMQIHNCMRRMKII